MIGGSTSPHAVGAVCTYTHVTPTTVPASGAHLPAGTRSTEQSEVAQPGAAGRGRGPSAAHGRAVSSPRCHAGPPPAEVLQCPRDLFQQEGKPPQFPTHRAGTLPPATWRWAGTKQEVVEKHEAPAPSEHWLP